ncbi:hypothetical protein OHA98_25385 [Streptomyces sp. NBC_00654]|nr:hypothetical protein [Streptomyces sp. NBC_00654]MCX4968033.1 hypothetical protein [Streptomyces sp. NBC_00654]
MNSIASTITRTGLIVRASRRMVRSPEGRQICASTRSAHSKIG